MDANGSILEANDSFITMIEYKNSIKGKNIVDFLFKEDIDDWLFAFNAYFSDVGNKTVLNIRYNKGNSTRWWKLFLNKITIKDDVYILGVVIDISDEIESQGDLLIAKQAAEKSEASKSIFLANMSHEIRTPIHTITGLAELMGTTKLDDEQREYLTQIDFAAKVLLTLINDILDFSKIEAGKLTFENIEYDLYNTIINSVDLSALEAHKKGVDVGISIDPHMPMYIVGDQVRLRQILVNLMSNAVKFTKVGQIILSVKSRNDDLGNTFLKFAVTDSGIGISKAKQVKLFQAFSQADVSTTREFGGTGLGLSISSNLVNMMNGHLSVDSKEGEGASFFFEVPITKGQDTPLPYLLPPIKGLKVLVVDDNLKINRIFSDTLREWNYEVIEVYNGMDAINELIIKASMGKPYDLCFIDQLLSGMDGWQLASEIHSNSLIGKTKTILMSLKGKGIEESKMKLLGWFQAYLTKPVRREELYDSIDDLYSRTSDQEISNDDSDIGEIEELESIDEDDDYMEPLQFSKDRDLNEIEELIPIDDKEYIHELHNFSSMAFSEVEDEVDIFEMPDDNFLERNILVVEDHLVNQKLFKIMLEKAGHNVHVASDGQEALSFVDSMKLDLIFMDCQMPIMNGYDSSTAIREKGYTIPIIAVTASAVVGEYEKCINSGMNDVMTKPFKNKDIIHYLEKWMK